MKHRAFKVIICTTIGLELLSNNKDCTVIYQAPFHVPSIISRSFFIQLILKAVLYFTETEISTLLKVMQFLSYGTRFLNSPGIQTPVILTPCPFCSALMPFLCTARERERVVNLITIMEQGSFHHGCKTLTHRLPLECIRLKPRVSPYGGPLLKGPGVLNTQKLTTLWNQLRIFSLEWKAESFIEEQELWFLPSYYVLKTVLDTFMHAFQLIFTTAH